MLPNSLVIVFDLFDGFLSFVFSNEKTVISNIKNIPKPFVNSLLQ
jgi:hypothetical protein